MSDDRGTWQLLSSQVPGAQEMRGLMPPHSWEGPEGVISPQPLSLLEEGMCLRV